MPHSARWQVLSFACSQPEKGTRMKSRLTLTEAQAAVLARLIRMQLDAYDEAVGGENRKEIEPLNGSELDLLEPLVALLEHG